MDSLTQCSHCGAGVDEAQLRDDFCLYCGTVLPHAAAALKPAAVTAQARPKRSPKPAKKAPTPALDRLPKEERQQLIEKAGRKLLNERLRIRAEVRQEFGLGVPKPQPPKTNRLRFIIAPCLVIVAGLAITVLFPEATLMRENDGIHGYGKTTEVKWGLIGGFTLSWGGFMLGLPAYAHWRKSAADRELRAGHLAIVCTAALCAGRLLVWLVKG